MDLWLSCSFRCGSQVAKALDWSGKCWKDTWNSGARYIFNSSMMVSSTFFKLSVPLTSWSYGFCIQIVAYFSFICPCLYHWYNSLFFLGGGVSIWTFVPLFKFTVFLASQELVKNMKSLLSQLRWILLPSTPPKTRRGEAGGLGVG